MFPKKIVYFRYTLIICCEELGSITSYDTNAAWERKDEIA